jgi:hypothetical protein
MKPFWVVLSVYQLTTDPIVKQSTLEQPKGVFLFPLGLDWSAKNNSVQDTSATVG